METEYGRGDSKVALLLSLTKKNKTSLKKSNTNLLQYLKEKISFHVIRHHIPFRQTIESLPDKERNAQRRRISQYFDIRNIFSDSVTARWMTIMWCRHENKLLFTLVYFKAFTHDAKSSMTGLQCVHFFYKEKENCRFNKAIIISYDRSAMCV